MAGERLITFNAYYLLIFQTSLIILIILPRQLFSQQVTFFGRLNFLFLWYISYSEYFPLFEKKKEKKRKKPWGEDSAIEKKATVKNIDYLTFLRLLLSQFFFSNLCFFKHPHSWKDLWNSMRGRKPTVRYFDVFISVLHISQTVFMQIAKGKKKNEENDAFDLCC